MKYARNVVIALDQAANALLGGDPDETLSSRLHRAQSGELGYFASRVMLGMMPTRTKKAMSAS